MEYKGGAMLPVYSLGGTRVCDIPPEPRSRVRARPRGSRPAAWPPRDAGFDLTGAVRGALRSDEGLVASCRGTFENQAKGIVTRWAETPEVASAAPMARDRPLEAGRWNLGRWRESQSAK
jgi:hypothetical protein